jgi:hypothetical protein
MSSQAEILQDVIGFFKFDMSNVSPVHSKRITTQVQAEKSNTRAKKRSVATIEHDFVGF